MLYILYGSCFLTSLLVFMLINENNSIGFNIITIINSLIFIGSIYGFYWTYIKKELDSYNSASVKHIHPKSKSNTEALLPETLKENIISDYQKPLTSPEFSNWYFEKYRELDDFNESIFADLSSIADIIMIDILPERNEYIRSYLKKHQLIAETYYRYHISYSGRKEIKEKKYINDLLSIKTEGFSDFVEFLKYKKFLDFNNNYVNSFIKKYESSNSEVMAVYLKIIEEQYAYHEINRIDTLSYYFHKNKYISSSLSKKGLENTAQNWIEFVKQEFIVNDKNRWSPLNLFQISVLLKIKFDYSDVDIFEEFIEFLRRVKKCEENIELNQKMKLYETELLSNPPIMDIKRYLAEIDKMEGYEFEGFLKKQFENLDYSVKLTKKSRDQGGDLILKKGRKTIIVQAKRYSSPVGNGAVQEISAAVNYYKADIGVIITNNYYSKAAQELAVPNNILLIDRTGLIKIIEGKDIL